MMNMNDTRTDILSASTSADTFDFDDLGSDAGLDLAASITASITEIANPAMHIALSPDRVRKVLFNVGGSLHDNEPVSGANLLQLIRDELMLMLKQDSVATADHPPPPPASVPLPVMIKPELIKSEPAATPPASFTDFLEDSLMPPSQMSAPTQRWEKISPTDDSVCGALNADISPVDKHGKSVGGPWNVQSRGTCNMCAAVLPACSSGRRDRVNCCDDCMDTSSLYRSVMNPLLVTRWCAACKQPEHISMFSSLTAKSCKARNQKGAQAKMAERKWERMYPEHSEKRVATLKQEIQDLGGNIKDGQGAPLKKQQLRDLLVELLEHSAGKHSAGKREQHVSRAPKRRRGVSDLV
jgi:hypothetical protein